MSGDYIRELLESRDGALWIATSRRGLKRLQGGQLTRWTVADGLPGNDLYSLHEDEEGAIWIGTAAGGLCRLKDGRIVRYSVADGLFEDSIYRILEDNRRDLWISGRNGIYRLDRGQLEDFAAGKLKRISFVPHGKNDGMPTAECRGGHQPAGCKTRDGRLWFPTTRGVVVVDPSRTETRQYSPKAIIERTQLNSRQVNPGERASVAAGAGRLEILYTAPSFADPQKVRFRYRLRGLGDDWVDAGARRAADYTNLPPGSYEFEVLASDKVDSWATPAAVFRFELLPGFYQTSWFYLTCGATLLLLAFAAHRYRMLRMQSRFSAVLSERVRIAREIHDTVLQGLTGISAHLEAISALLPNSPASALEALERTRVLARSAVQESRRSILGLRGRPPETGSLIRSLKENAKEISAQTPVDLQVQVGGQYRSLSELVESNLLRIAQEAIANAVRHAKATHITVELSFNHAAVRLAVQDDGRGFKEPEAGRDQYHFGIVGMRERANEMGARFELNSAEGLGTVVAVTVPLDRCKP
jgi:signal transduction histidine kinase